MAMHIARNDNTHMGGEYSSPVNRGMKHTMHVRPIPLTQYIHDVATRILYGFMVLKTQLEFWSE